MARACNLLGLVEVQGHSFIVAAPVFLAQNHDLLSVVGAYELLDYFLGDIPANILAVVREHFCVWFYSAPSGFNFGGLALLEMQGLAGLVVIFGDDVGREGSFVRVVGET